MMNRIVKAITETANSPAEDRIEHLKLVRRYAGLDGRASSYRVAAAKTAAVVAFLTAAGLVADADFTANAPAQCPYMSVIRLNPTRNVSEFGLDLDAVAPALSPAMMDGAVTCADLLDALVVSASDINASEVAEAICSIATPEEIYAHMRELAAKNPDAELAKKLVDVIDKAMSMDMATPPLWVMELVARPFTNTPEPPRPLCREDWTLTPSYSGPMCLRYLRPDERSCNLQALASTPSLELMETPAFSTYLASQASTIKAYGTRGKAAILGIISANLDIAGENAAKKAVDIANAKTFWPYIESVIQTATGIQSLRVAHPSRVGMFNNSDDGNAVAICVFYANVSSYPDESIGEFAAVERSTRTVEIRRSGDPDPYADHGLVPSDLPKILYAATHLEPGAEKTDLVVATDASPAGIRETYGIRALRKRTEAVNADDCRGNSSAFFHSRTPAGLIASHTPLSRFFADLVLIFRRRAKANLKAVAVSKDQTHRAPAPNIVSAVYCGYDGQALRELSSLPWQDFTDDRTLTAVTDLEKKFDGFVGHQLDMDENSRRSAVMFIETNISVRALSNVERSELTVIRHMIESAAIYRLMAGLVDDGYCPSLYESNESIPTKISRAVCAARSRLESENEIRYGTKVKRLAPIGDNIGRTVGSEALPVEVAFCSSTTDRLFIAIRFTPAAASAMVHMFCCNNMLPLYPEGHPMLDDGSVVVVNSYDGWKEARKVLLAAVERKDASGRLGQANAVSIGDMRFRCFTDYQRSELTASRFKTFSYALDEFVTA